MEFLKNPNKKAKYTYIHTRMYVLFLHLISIFLNNIYSLLLFFRLANAII